MTLDGGDKSSQTLSKLDKLPGISEGDKVTSGVYLFTINNGTDYDKKLKELQKVPGIKSAEKNQRFKKMAVPNDPSYGSLWYVAPEPWPHAFSAVSCLRQGLPC